MDSWHPGKYVVQIFEHKETLLIEVFLVEHINIPFGELFWRYTNEQECHTLAASVQSGLFKTVRRVRE